MTRVMSLARWSGLFGILVALFMGAALTASPAAAAAAGPATATYASSGACGQVTFRASAEGSNVTNQYLVVSTEGARAFAKIPTDGTEAIITVGPFVGDVTVYWNVFGGAERNYDQPLWNGYGEPGFAASINAYAASQGGFSWVLDGHEDPNPFTNFYEVEVEGCLPHQGLDDACVNRFTGVVRDLPRCTSMFPSVDFDASDNLCANKYTGIVSLRDTGCRAYENVVVYEETPVCVSRYTHGLRVPHGNTCQPHEEIRVIT